MPAFCRHWLVLSITCLSVMAGICGCNTPSADRIEEPKSVVGSAAGSEEPSVGGIADDIRRTNELEDTAAAELNLPTDINALMASLARKEIEQQRAADGETYIKIQRYRLAAASKLLQLEINQEQRVGFVKIKMDALLQLASMGDAVACNELPKALNTYTSDKEPRIRQWAALASFTHDLRQRAKTSDASLQPMLDTLTNLAQEWPDNFEVCRGLGSVIGELNEPRHRESQTRMTWALVNAYSNSPNAAARNYVEKMESQLRIKSANLDMIVREIRDQQEGALERYEESIQRLANDPAAQQEILEPILGSLAWLERTGQVASTLQANQIVTRLANQMPESPRRRKLLDLCRTQATRLGLPGQPFSLQALDSNDQPLDWPNFSNGSPVVVIFWSPSEAASLRLVQQLMKLPEFQAEGKAKLLAVNVSNKRDTDDLFPEAPARMATVHLSEDISGQYFRKNFGLERVPQILLVDRDGVIGEVNPPPNLLRSAIEKLTP